MTCTTCTFVGNTARGGGGGGAAVYHGASLTITGGTFSSNVAVTGPGGAVYAQDSGTFMHVANSSFFNHTAGGYGGTTASLYFTNTLLEVRPPRPAYNEPANAVSAVCFSSRWNTASITPLDPPRLRASMSASRGPSSTADASTAT